MSRGINRDFTRSSLYFVGNVPSGPRAGGDRDNGGSVTTDEFGRAMKRSRQE